MIYTIIHSAQMLSGEPVTPHGATFELAHLQLRADAFIKISASRVVDITILEVKGISV